MFVQIVSHKPAFLQQETCSPERLRLHYPYVYWVKMDLTLCSVLGNLKTDLASDVSSCVNVVEAQWTFGSIYTMTHGLMHCLHLAIIHNFLSFYYNWSFLSSIQTRIFRSSTIHYENSLFPLIKQTVFFFFAAFDPSHSRHGAKQKYVLKQTCATCSPGCPWLINHELKQMKNYCFYFDVCIISVWMLLWPWALNRYNNKWCLTNPNADPLLLIITSQLPFT